MFILESLWPMLRLHQILGIFPCSKDTVEEGKYILRPSKGIYHFIKYFGTLILAYIPHYIFNIILAMNQEQSLMEFLYSSKIMDSPKNFMIMISIIVCILCQHLIMMTCIWKLRFHLCQLQDFLNEKSLSMLKNAWYDWGLRLIVTLFLMTNVILALGMSYAHIDDPDLYSNKFLIILLVLSTSFIIFITDSPVICFLIILVNMFKTIHNWAQSLTKMSLEQNELVWSETQDFIVHWKKVRSLLSFLIFILVLNTLFISVLILYRGIAFFTDTSTDTSLIMVFAGYISVGITLAYSLAFINFYPQMINEEITVLTENLHQFSRKDEINGNVSNHQSILRSLIQWQGFTGYEFFTLGKPLLSSIVSAFMTYLIVLVQFQTSQK